MKQKTFKNYPIPVTFDAKVMKIEHKAGEGKNGFWYLTRFVCPFPESDRREESNSDTLWLRCAHFSDTQGALAHVVAGQVYRISGILKLGDWGLELSVLSVVSMSEGDDDNDD